MKRISFLLVLTLLLSFGSAGAMEFLPRLAVVEWASSDTDMLYEYYCAVPMNCFHFDGEVYLNPLTLGDNSSDLWDYFMEDWDGYLQEASTSLEKLLVIGDVDTGLVGELMDEFALDDEDVVYFTGDAQTIAEDIASHDWDYAESAVLVPYTSSSPSDDMLVSAANGASLASWNNIPLLLVDTSGIADSTIDVMIALGVSSVYVVDLGSDMPADLASDLSDAGITISETLSSETDITAKMRDLSGEPTLCAYAGDIDQSMPAAFSAAVYGGFVFCVDDHTVGIANELMAEIIAAQPPGIQEKLPEPLKIFPSGEQTIADNFCDWMEDIGADDPNRLETVLTFAIKSHLGYNYDRAIYGDPDEPDERGCLAGRFPFEVRRNVLFANRALLYTAVIFANPRPLHFTAVMVAYEAENTTPYSYGPFTDNEGDQHVVNEIFGCAELPYDDPGVWEAVDENGYNPEGHNGRNAGSTPHDFQPTVDPVGFFADINDGSNFFYNSSHGGSSGVSVMNTDTGFCEDVSYPDTYWPATDGRVNKSGSYTLGPSGLNSNCENLHGIISIFNACSVATGSLMETFIEHGGSASVSSYTSVSFIGSGWYWCLFINAIAREDETLGYANAYANARTSDVFPQHDYGVDSSLRYLLLGDPNMHYVQSYWTCPDPADPYGDYGGHCPGGSIGIEVGSFEAGWDGRVVLLSWTVHTDEEFAGFNLYRAETSLMDENRDFSSIGDNSVGKNSGWVKVNGELIVGQSPFNFSDATAHEDMHYTYRLVAVVEEEEETLAGTEVTTSTLPTGFTLAQNFPNPFSEVTTIVVGVPQGGKTETINLKIYDLSGRLIETLFSGSLSEGEHSFLWAGRDAAGSPLPSGIYLCALQAETSWQTIKMVLAR